MPMFSTKLNFYLACEKALATLGYLRHQHQQPEDRQLIHMGYYFVYLALGYGHLCLPMTNILKTPRKTGKLWKIPPWRIKSRKNRNSVTDYA